VGLKRSFDSFSKRWVLPFGGHRAGTSVYSAVVLRDGRHLITSATDGAHKLWDVSCARGLATMDGHSPSHSTRPSLVRPSPPQSIHLLPVTRVAAWADHAWPVLR
jgi:WD40 repeat protein